MKFAQSFESALQVDDYPSHWMSSAISYRRLKKGIKSVKQELSSIGLDKDNIGFMRDKNAPERRAQYTFAGINHAYLSFYGN